jgi:hypothetical protein
MYYLQRLGYVVGLGALSTRYVLQRGAGQVKKSMVGDEVELKLRKLDVMFEALKYSVDLLEKQ